jgi:hypothetical protein
MYCIGIDQSYANCGVAISKDGILISALSHKPKGKNKAEKRLDFYSKLIEIASEIAEFAGKGGLVVVYERIRMYSKGFVSMPYIVATAALCGTIQEIAFELDAECYSVDTRAWKKAVVGTVDKQQNDEKIPPEKYPTILWAREQAAIDSDEKDNDLCDAAAISQTWWACKDKLKDEMK